MRLNLFFLLLFINVLTSCNGQTQTAANSNIAAGDTLSKLGNSILIVFQASNGDYWFGSDTSGVYRFDGKRIIHFSTLNGLSSNRIRSIQEDNKGNIYLATLEGISKFDGQTFTMLVPIKSTARLDNWRLQPGDLWFNMPGKNGDKGPYRYDGKNLYQLEFPKHYMEDEYFARNPVRAWSPYEVYYIYKDSKGVMWFGTSNFGVCRYDGKSFSWLYEDHLTNVPNGGSFGIRSVIEDTKGKYWFCNTRFRYNISPDSIKENGKVLVKYKAEEGIKEINPGDGSDHVYFMSAITDSRGHLWMATYNQGVWRYDGKNVVNYQVENGAGPVTLYTIYKDNKGDIWLGTHQSGAYKFNGRTFEKFVLQ